MFDQILRLFYCISLFFLALHADDNDPEFRVFKKQLYHASLVRILWPIKDAMTTPEVALCPDGHFRRVIYSLGPYIADYPEQVLLVGIVQGWCPKYIYNYYA